MTGDELKQKCQQLGITQQALAEATRFSMAWIAQNWQRGDHEITPKLEKHFREEVKNAKK